MENMKLHSLDLWLKFLAITRRAVHDTKKIAYAEIDEYITKTFQDEMEHWENANDMEMLEATNVMGQMVYQTVRGLNIEGEDD